MAKKKRQKGVEPKRLTAAGWIRQMQKEYGKEKLKRGYNAHVTE